MKLLTLIFCCVALLSTQLRTADGIDCYDCNTCKDPFKKEDHTVTSGHTHCMKTYALGYAVRKGVSVDCTQAAIGNTGVFCCQTNLCNGGENDGENGGENGGETKFGIRTAILAVTTGSLVFLLQAKMF